MVSRIAIVIGDPAGVGAELLASVLSGEATRNGAEFLIVGDRRVLAQGEETVGVRLDLAPGDPNGQSQPGRIAMLDMGNGDPATIEMGKVSASAGRSALENFTKALDLAQAGRVDAITFLPFNKESLRLGGLTHADELAFAADRLGAERYAEFNVVDRLWNARVTSHVPLREVADLITQERLIDRLTLTDQVMRSTGYVSPRIAVAALNPHAGDGGAFGREDLDVIGPAVEKARAMGINAHGPFPSDTVFLRAREGAYDAIQTMYHDQGQIAIKLLGFDKGVTVLAGLPVPITTPAHGTAYDIAGKGVANPEPTRRAFEIACRMAKAT